MASPKKNSAVKRGGNAKTAPARREKETPQASGNFNSTTQPLLFLLMLVAGLLLLAALMLFENGQPFFGDGNPVLWGDRGWLQSLVVTSEPNLTNPMGKLGATVAVVAFYMFGLAAFMFPVFLFLFAYYMARFRADISLSWKTFLMFLVMQKRWNMII